MGRYLFLLTLGQILWTCNRHNRPPQQVELALKDTIQLVNKATLGLDSVRVDDTFISVPSTTNDVNCNIYGSVIARSDGKIGYIDYDEITSMYFISYGFPGSIDEQWTGYVCNLPDSYKRSRLKVGFVGNYYAARKFVKPRHASDAPLYLVLEKIKAL